MLEHDHKLVGLRIALEMSGMAHSWTPEHEIRSFIFKKHGLRGMKDRIVPDGLMGIEVGGERHSVAIELELTLKNKTKLRKALGRYIEKGGFHALWYVAPKKSILDSVWRQWLAMGGQRSGIKLYASILSEVLAEPAKARLMGEKPHRPMSDVWTKLPAQVVSNQMDEENHAPSFEEAS